MIKVSVIVNYDESDESLTLVSTEISEVSSEEYGAAEDIDLNYPFTLNEAFLGNLILVAGEKFVEALLRKKPSVIRLRVEEIWSEATRLTDVAIAENSALGNISDETDPEDRLLRGE
jgi:hypothetical protein